METYKLLNGNLIPRLGYGTWKNRDQEELSQSVGQAYAVGFRLFDGASAYQNEKAFGQALVDNKIPREDLFITSKLANHDHGYDEVFQAVAQTLSDLQTDYLDLYLIHWPVVKGHQEDWPVHNQETWRAMEELYEAGTLKAIGVSNFSINHLESLFETAKHKPVVNQILFHPGVLQEELVAFCKAHQIVVEAYSPLACLSLLSEEEWANDIATKHNKSLAQVILRFVYQSGVVPLTKSSHADRIQSNFAIFDFELDAGDMEALRNWEHPDLYPPNNWDQRPAQVF